MKPKRRDTPRPLLFARAAAAIAVAGGTLLFAGWLLGFGSVLRPFISGPFMHPLMPLAIVLYGACLWFCTRTSPPAHLVRWLAGLVATCGALVAVTQALGWLPAWNAQLFPEFVAQSSRHGGNPATATGTCVALIGLSIAFLDRGSMRVRSLMQFAVVPVFWVTYLAILMRFFGGTSTKALFSWVVMPLHAAALLAVLALGILLARPRYGLMAALYSPSTGGSLARIMLPIVAVLPFTVGWVRLQALRDGGFDPGSVFALTSTTNVLMFALFIWFSARTLNLLDVRRRQAFESLQTANEEMQRVNTVLEAKIAEQIKTEEARKQTEQELFQSQKMEAMGTLASGIAHDFNNILTVILLNAEAAREASPDIPLLRNSLHEIKKSGTRAADVIRQIMAFGRKSPGEHIALRLDTVVSDAVDMLRHALPTTIQIQTDVERNLPKVTADATQIQQVLLNLGTNAAHAMSETGGTLEIRIKSATIASTRAALSPDLCEGDYVVITVRDTGHGMDEETRKRVFDPFFTTKPPGKGTGLGLSVAHGIMRLHGGSITVYSEPGRGTAFNLYFPIVAGDMTAPKQMVAKADVPRGQGELILCVDDDPPLVGAIARRLERSGYATVRHTDPRAALEDFRSRPGDFHLVLTDFSMPEMSGREFAVELLRIRPGIPVILMSGFLGPDEAESVKNSGVRHIVLKPDVLSELDEVVHRLLAEADEGERPHAETGKAG
jgi:signal transduction histidine kinase/ActR/RegA family two-component response regulator